MITKETEKRIVKFRDDREWKPFHNPKDLAISVSLEAAELLETFQWSGEATEVPEKLGAIGEEIADVRERYRLYQLTPPRKRHHRLNMEDAVVKKGARPDEQA